MGFARIVANRILVLAEVSLLEEVTPEEIIRTPKHDRTRAFMDKILE